MRSRWLPSALVFLIFALVFVRGEQLMVGLKGNIVEALIHKSFSQDQADAESRQRAMAWAAFFLGRDTDLSFPETESDDGIAMIPAALRGLFYQRQSDRDEAAAWYDAAAHADPTPKTQKQILISPWMQLTPNGDFVLAGDSNAWRKRPDTDPRAVVKRTERGSLTFSCSDVGENEKKAALVWQESFDIPYHHSLALHAKVDSGTRLDFETVVDGQLIRQLTHSGEGSWQDFPMTVDGDRVKVLYVIIREEAGAEEKSCQVEIDSITFLLDEEMKHGSAK